MFFKTLSIPRYILKHLRESQRLYALQSTILLLAPQSGAHSIGAFRDPIPSNPSTQGRGPRKNGHKHIKINFFTTKQKRPDFFQIFSRSPSLIAFEHLSLYIQKHLIVQKHSMVICGTTGPLVDHY